MTENFSTVQKRENVAVFYANILHFLINIYHCIFLYIYTVGNKDHKDFFGTNKKLFNKNTF